VKRTIRVGAVLLTAAVSALGFAGTANAGQYNDIATQTVYSAACPEAYQTLIAWNSSSARPGQVEASTTANNAFTANDCAPGTVLAQQFVVGYKDGRLVDYGVRTASVKDTTYTWSVGQNATFDYSAVAYFQLNSWTCTSGACSRVHYAQVFTDGRTATGLA
jgi:hypothetical protein